MGVRRHRDVQLALTTSPLRTCPGMMVGAAVAVQPLGAVTANLTWSRARMPLLANVAVTVVVPPGATSAGPAWTCKVPYGTGRPARGTSRTRRRTAALPSAGWLAVTVTVPGEPGSERIQLAPTPPAAAKSNGLSPISTAGPRNRSVTCPVTYGRGAPYRSTARNTHRVVSTPSPSIS